MQKRVAEQKNAKSVLENRGYGYRVYQASYSDGRETVIANIESMMKGGVESYLRAQQITNVTVNSVTWINPLDPLPEPVLDTSSGIPGAHVRREYSFNVSLTGSDGSSETVSSIKGIVEIE